MIDSLSKIECTGCNACIDVCPTKAIYLKTDQEGFWYPNITIDKCTKCELCNKICPVINLDKIKINDFNKPTCYAAIHNNIEIRFDSTSGGLFTAISEEIFEEGGYVGGAIFTDNFSVKHIITKDNKDLKKIRSSKYLQSNASEMYKKALALLKDNNKVLICGTPCQIAGLRCYLGESNENLITVDFVCRGVNSPMVFREYLDWLEYQNSSKVKSVKFKNKEYGWRQLTTKITFDNGNTIYDTKDKSIFMKGFLQANAFCRPSCYECKFKGFPRIADITLADYWGIENYNFKFDHDLGTSMVLINSFRGQNYFNNIKSRIQFKELDIQTIFRGNLALEKSLTLTNIRKIWFERMNSTSFYDTANVLLNNANFSFKKRFFLIIKKLYIVKKFTQLKPKPILQFLYYNFINRKKCFRQNYSSYLIPTPNTIIEIHKNSKLLISGLLIFGRKKVKRSKLESRLLIENGGTLEVLDDFSIGYGANIEIFKNAKLIIKGGKGAYTNINTTIICNEQIEIGEGLRCGRNVTIRDNNGGHFISKKGYQDSKPIKIGNKVWLGEGCLILPGITIGDGAIVGARAVVTKDIPPNSVVKGIPAKVTDTNIIWK
jgi:acetyltransferase-like isoleucine patch superfamily enzyme/coenzyme F420-reducing hydrogenase beta subunit